MKSMPWICLGLALAAAPAAAVAQPAADSRTSQLPVEKSDGYNTAQKLNKSITQQNAEAAAREAADQAAYRAQQAAVEQANRDAAAKHDAQVRATEEAAARSQAAFDAETRAYQARVAAQAAEDAAKARAYQAQLDAARAAQAQYEKDLLDYKACVGGDRSKCKS